MRLPCCQTAVDSGPDFDHKGQHCQIRCTGFVKVPTEVELRALGSPVVSDVQTRYCWPLQADRITWRQNILKKDRGSPHRKDMELCSEKRFSRGYVERKINNNVETNHNNDIWEYVALPTQPLPQCTIRTLLLIPVFITTVTYHQSIITIMPLIICPYIRP